MGSPLTSPLEDPAWICAHGQDGVGLLGLLCPERYGLFRVWAVSSDGPPNGSKKSFVRDSVGPESGDPRNEALEGR